MAFLAWNAFTAVLIFILTFIIVYILFFSRRRIVAKGDLPLPPCLPSVPILGSLPFMSCYEDLHWHLLEKSKELGPVVAFYSGSTYAISLNNRDVIREALIKRGSHFADRFPWLPERMFLNPNLYGIAMHPYDSAFKRYHHLSLTTLKKFGWGNPIAEQHVHTENENLKMLVRQTNGRAFDPRRMIMLTTLNVVAAMTYGKRWENDDEDYVKMHDAVHEFTEILSPSLNVFPSLRFLPYYRQHIRDMRAYLKTMFDIIDRTIDKCVRGYDAGVGSFVSTYIDGDGGPNWNRQQLRHSLRDLMVGGSETSATQIMWGILTLANDQELQARLLNEIESNIPEGHHMSYDDRNVLPFLDATVLELMRFYTLIQLAIPHRTRCDTEVNGYFIPEGALVIVNVHGANNDPDDWGDPEVFRPDRFLDEDGNVVGRERVLNFSMGKRACLGELLARQEVFVVIGGLVRDFHIVPPKGQTKIKVGMIVFNTQAPTPFDVRMVPRKETAPVRVCT